MKKYLTLAKQFYREIIRGLYFVLAILLILVFLPREGKFKYEFQKGKAWMHEDLIAPFDFPIYKTDAELITERSSILSNFKPFFRYEPAAVSLSVKAFQNDYEPFTEKDIKAKGHSSKIADTHAAKIVDLLQFVHLKGVLNPSDHTELRDKIHSGITIINDNIAVEMSFDDIFTIEKALNYLQTEIDKHANTSDPAIKELHNQLTLNKYITPNLHYDAQTSERVSQEMLANLSLTKGLVYAGERIVTKGESINSDLYQILFSLKRDFENRIGFSGDIRMLIAGQSLLVTILFVVLFLFLLNFRREILNDDSKILFILLLITTMTIISSLLLKRNLVSVYIIPFAIIPIFIRTFYDSRLALFIHLVTVFLVGFFVPNSFEFVFINFIAGIVAILSLSKLYRRGKLFLSMSLIFSAYVLVYMGIVTIQEGSPLSMNMLNIAWFAGNALLLLASYQLIYLFEKVFGFLSDTTLMELSDTNQDLLRKLAEVAPGTFQHSLQVANLAESAIFMIGGNPLLVRAGALYHDIGKMGNPSYFVENQTIDFNPHQGIDFEESAEIIIKHVTNGVQIARKHGIPEQIIDFIQTHHGTTKVQYFYRLYRDKFPDAKDELKVFCYPGPKPSSRETAVLMMADSVEAASRSLKTLTHNTIEELVENIINYQQIEEQFNDSNITFKDISIIKSVFKKKLLNIYHARIEYPKEPVEN